MATAMTESYDSGHAHNGETKKSKPVSPARRLASLSSLVEGLGHAIQGMASLGPAGLPKMIELSDELLRVSKRATWVERMGDETWKQRNSG